MRERFVIRSDIGREDGCTDRDYTHALGVLLFTHLRLIDVWMAESKQIDQVVVVLL